MIFPRSAFSLRWLFASKRLSQLCSGTLYLSCPVQGCMPCQTSRHVQKIFRQLSMIHVLQKTGGISTCLLSRMPACRRWTQPWCKSRWHRPARGAGCRGALQTASSPAAQAGPAHSLTFHLSVLHTATTLSPTMPLCESAAAEVHGNVTRHAFSQP